jgi:hypothetical protein
MFRSDFARLKNGVLKVPKRVLVVVLSLIAAVVFAPSAGAAVTLGSDLSQPAADGVACSTSCTVVQSGLPGRTITSPLDGVIVRWRIRTNGAGGPFQLRVAEPFTGDQRIGAGWSAAGSASAAGISEFQTRMQIHAGANIGLDFNSSNAAFFKSASAVAGATSLYFKPILPDGIAATPVNVNTGTEMLYNADVEADADRDGYGDETQDKCVGTFGTAEGCDKSAPVPVLTTASPQKIGSLKVYVSVNEAASVELRTTVGYKSKGKSVTIKAKLAKVALNGTSPSTKVALKFTSKQRSKIRGLLKKGRKLSAKLALVATDPSGNAATINTKIQLTKG